MPRPHLFPYFPHLAIITSVSLCCWMAGDSWAGPYLNSAHGGLNGSGPGVVRTGTVLAVPYAAGNCAHCHEQHGKIGGSEPDPQKPGPSNFLLLDDLAGNAACNYCHDISGKNGADNIASQILKASSHDPNYGTGAALCNDCHDSHVAQKTNHVEATDGNTIPATSPLLSVKGTSVSNWTAGAPGPGAENLGTLGLNALAEPITYEYELCFRCHAVQPPIAANLDVGLQFNPNNYSVHPVATEANLTWTNAFLAGPPPPAPPALLGNWVGNVNAEMYCSDCHGSETGTDPKGPHGSTNPYLLKLSGPGPSLDNLCLSCHNPLVSSAWVDPGNPQPALIGDHTLPAHLQGPGNPDGCLACHGGIGNPLLVSSIHGANYQWPAFGGFPGVPSRFFLLPYVGANPFAPLPYITGNTFNPVDARGTRICTSPCHVAPGGPGYFY